jgi:hypothetical protein
MWESELRKPIIYLKEQKNVLNEVELVEEEALVQPLTFVEVVESGFRERDHYTREYLKAYHQPFIETIAKIPEGESIEEVCEKRPHYVQLATILTAFQEAQLLLEAEIQRYDVAVNDYEEQKGRAKKYPQKQKLTKQWSEVEQPLFLYDIDAERQKLFAISQLFIGDFFLTKDGIGNLLSGCNELIDDNTANVELISQFLGHIAQEIQQYRKKPQQYDLQNLSYRREFDPNDNLMEIINHSALSDLVSLSLLSSSGSEQSVNIVYHQVQNIVESILQLYWQKNDQILGKQEKTPLLTFTHDYLFAAGLRGNEDLFFDAIQKATTLLMSRQGQFADEIKKALKFSFDEVAETVQFAENIDIGPDANVLSSEEGKKDIAKALLSRGGYHSLIGKYYEIFSAVAALHELAVIYDWKATATLFSHRQYTNLISGQVLQNVSASKAAVSIKTLLTSEDPHRPGLADIATLSFSPKSMLAKTYYRDFNNRSDEKIFQKEVHLLSARDLVKQGKSGYGENFEILHYLFLDVVPRSVQELRKMRESNQVLIHGVNNEYTHFIAHCGDQFHSTLNPFLPPGLRSVTFYPVYGVSGEYTIRLEVDLGADSAPAQTHFLDLLLMQNGKITHTREQIKQFALPYYLLEPLSATVLPLLHHITSGEYLKENSKRVLLSTAEEKNAQERNIQSRRPHWMLTAPGSTLKSWGALQHQDEVREDFGLDIIAENMRRKEAGVLPVERYITYNRGYLQSPDVEPNQWTFDPNKR